jgi:hypothetical protein
MKTLWLRFVRWLSRSEIARLDRCNSAAVRANDEYHEARYIKLYMEHQRLRDVARDQYCALEAVADQLPNDQVGELVRSWVKKHLNPDSRDRSAQTK